MFYVDAFTPISRTSQVCNYESCCRLLGSYEALEGGELADALIDFTGGFTECIQAKSAIDGTIQPLSVAEENSNLLSHGTSENNAQSVISTDPDRMSPCFSSSESAFSILIQRHFDLTLIAAAISADNLAELESETELGLIVGHAYAVTRICSVPSRVAGKDIRLVCLTNPWGHGSWRGRFAHGSKDWENLPQSFKDCFPCDTNSDESGQFWMLFDDFLEQFNYIVLCHVPIGDDTMFRPGLAHRFFTNSSFAPDDRMSCSRTLFPYDGTSNSEDFSSAFRLPYMEFWTEVAIHGSWNASTSGGCLNFTNTFLNNPQIAFDVSHPDGSSLVLCLLQKTNRNFDRCDSTTGLHHIGMSLFRVEPNRTVHITSLQEPIDFIINSLYRNSRVVWLRLDNLPAGRYVVVPTTFGSECVADFMLRLIGPPPITAFQLKVDNNHRSRSPHRCKSQAFQTRSPAARLRRWLGVPRSPAPRASISPLVSPVPGSNLQRVTLVEATVRFPRLLFQTMFTNATAQYSGTGRPRVYARLTAFGQKINGSLCHLTSLDRGKCTGVVRFEEGFLFPTNTKELLRIQLFIRNPVFDELCGECDLLLSASSRSARRTLHHLAVHIPHSQQPIGLPELSPSSQPSSPPPQIRSSRIRALIGSALNRSDTDRDRAKCSLRAAFSQSDQLIQLKTTSVQLGHEYRTDWLSLMPGSDTDCMRSRNLSTTNRRGLLSVLVECD